ncbi:MAG: mechanosensitive ion channel [Gammaproteobacteria bacterium]|nr:mechanosensitive ion channel [Gammaproteobacteria bacterium]NNF49348.1 mechanosensitive ion channel family protein [Woeseiaceae bacterium]MBT8093579.1 mechanosensitive ion channel [Gammaproteobacteria bacterium]MBT8106457.1 mechanosensitive ion channel [Gammaproteobacteria bacterium]NNK26472.1 mechanosensitive ion channel family protein [Woeseiaceae bacterium]
METIGLFIQGLAAVLVLGGVLWFGRRRLNHYFESRPHLKFRHQLIQIAAVLVAILFLILLLPVGGELRGQLLRLFGLIFSATIALSSTTLVGNIMAGLMLKAIGNCRPGNYITVGDYFGRISEVDLLHIEIQTEERDLTTLPNTYLVTHPVRVMRASGTLLSVEVSLGYDVSRRVIEDLLLKAATDSELESPYVQIRELGDFSVTYQVSGLLKEINRIIEKRRELRARTMDVLHGAGIEIVSPSFMNTRAIEKGQPFIPEVDEGDDATATGGSPDAMVFDKAEKAASVSKLRESLAEAETRLRACAEVIANPANELAAEAAKTEKERLENRIERLSALIARREENISKD